MDKTSIVTGSESKGREQTGAQDDRSGEDILAHLSDAQNYPEKTCTPYEEFRVGAKTYYFTPGGFLYRKDPGSEEVGGFFCGYLTDEVWHIRTGTAKI